MYKGIRNMNMQISSSRNTAWGTTGKFAWRQKCGFTIQHSTQLYRAKKITGGSIFVRGMLYSGGSRNWKGYRA